MSQFLETLVSILWGPPLVILLVGGGTYLAFVSRFLPLTGFLHALSLVSGRFHNKGDSKAKGQISHFQALSNALAATVGMGNIAGVAVAIYQGGPGAIFWMWVVALIGMNTKFFECTLSLMHRGQDFLGETQGGPMYVIEKGLPPSFRFVGYLFALFGLIGCLGLFQVNQLSLFLKDQYNLDGMLIGVSCALLVGYALKGGVRRLAHMTSALVPVMCLFYVLTCIYILLNNWESVPDKFLMIFSEALNVKAFSWGAGAEAFRVMMIGVKRAAFSNEAGVGTAPMAHGNAKTSEPVAEGLVAMLGPFLDTIIVCTMTALVILVSVPPGASSEAPGILLTVLAFEKSVPDWGIHLLGLAVFLFSFTTMLGMANYNEKCWNFLFRGRWGLGRNTFILVFCSTLVFGAISSIDVVVNLLDSGYALMAFPNMLATLLLAPKVKAAMKKYFDNIKRA